MATTAEHPYTAAYESQGVVYVSGALSVDPNGAVVRGRRRALDAALSKLAERLATVGLGLEDVVKTTYFVTDVTLRDEANAQYIAAFAEPRPARSFVEVSRLPYGATVEIEAVARTRAH
jgi:enamine deaminase RidA (YjgF/YER057c/UK114 family)